MALAPGLNHPGCLHKQTADQRRSHSCLIGCCWREGNRDTMELSVQRKDRSSEAGTEDSYLTYVLDIEESLMTKEAQQQDFRLGTYTLE